MARRLAFLLAAAAVAAVDLAHKAVAADGAVVYHERSRWYAPGIVLACALLGALVLRTGSIAVAFGGGVLGGAGVANALSTLAWPGVPDALVVTRGDTTVAFALADVFALAGMALLAAASAAFAVRNRHRLREPV